MAAKKFYAVRKGKVHGIFSSWEECKAAVEGFPGAEYKGFPDRQAAEEYLGVKRKAGSLEEDILKSCLPEKEEKVVAYVDGSYQHSLQKYSFGCVFLLADGRIFAENGSGNNPDSLLLRNVTGEMLGAMFAVRFAMKNGFQQIELRYDYEGIEKWVTGAWKNKTELTGKYASSMREWAKSIEISFTKVAAHTNVYYNEMADKLAKDALQKDCRIPKVQAIQDMTEYQENQE